MDIQQALKQVSFDKFARTEDGSLFPQSTRAEAVVNGIQMLDVQPGHHVLEIGTGSGYSTALLATLVGESGKVTSVDIDPSLTERARSKLSSYPWVECVTGDGRKGYQPNAPYDRIVAWTTPENIPDAWRTQIKTHGVLVTPFRVLPYAGCTVTVRLVHEDDGVFQGESVSKEGYILMTSDPTLNTVGMEIQADFVFGDGDEEQAWASSDWLKNTKSPEWGEKFLHAKPENSSFSGNGKDIRPYLLVNNPKGFTYAFRPGDGYWVGYSTPDGFALLSDHYSGKWIVSDKEYGDVLNSWIDQWHLLGKPGYDELLPIVMGDQIKVVFKKELQNVSE